MITFSKLLTSNIKRLTFNSEDCRFASMRDSESRISGTPTALRTAGKRACETSHCFTLIELIAVMVVLSIMASGTIYFAADMVQMTNTVRQVSRESQDAQFLLLRLSKEVTDVGSVTSVTGGNTIARSNGLHIYYDAGSNSILIGGVVLHDNVTSFNAVLSNQLLTLSLAVGQGPSISTAVYIR